MKIQKLFAGVISVLLWATLAGSVYGSINGDGEGKKREDGEAAAAEKSAADAKSAANSSSLSTEEQVLLLNEKVRKLEEIVDRQQRFIESLTAKPAAEAKTAATETAAISAVVPAASSAEAAQTASDEQAKKLDSLFKAFGQFNISGDLRARYDGQFDQGFDAPVGQPDRNRTRIRARVQLAGSFQNNFDWAIRVASGSFTLPTATNQTFTDFFNRKSVGFDRYFVRYNSKTEPSGVILQAGKFDYPWKRTDLTFDPALQPEGAAETIYYKGKNFLKEVKIVAFQLPFNETAVGKDSVLYGGQLLATVGSANWSFTGSGTFLNFNQSDAIARSLNRPNTQVGGGIEFGASNRLRRDAAGNVIGFVTNFNILDVIGEVTYSGYKKFPITLTLNYVRNMAERLEKLGERNAYWAEVKVGRLKEKGDIELTYAFARAEQDAFLSVYSLFDFLGTQTNGRNNRFTFGYTVNNNFFVQFVGLFTERFNTLPGSRNNRVQKRIFLDVNYRF